MESSKRQRPGWHAEHLDALRGLAVLAVLMVHVGESCHLPQPWNNISYSGQRGVQLFFVVSAFTLLLSSDNRRKAERRPTLNFFIRRFFRIAPMYYVAIAVTLVLDPVTAGSARDLLLGTFFLQGLSPATLFHVAPGAWTIADEALFYLLLPLLTLQIRSFRAALNWLLIAAPALAGLSFWLQHLFPANKDFFAFFWFPIELPVFLLGIATYFAWKEHFLPRFPRGSTKTKAASLAALALFALIYALNLPLDNRKLYFSGLGCAVLVLALTLHPWPLFVNRLTIFLGRISFSVYLLHVWPLIFTVRHTAALPAQLSPLPLFGVRFLGTSLLACALATLTWRFIEEGGISLGWRLIQRLEGRPATAPHPPAIADASHGSSPNEQF